MTIQIKNQKDQTITIIEDLQQDQIKETTSEKRYRYKSSKKRLTEFYVVTYFFVILFLALGGYYIHYVKDVAPEFIYNSYNSRFSTFADTVIRGDIISSDGKVLATTEIDNYGNETRKYPYSNLFAHSVGYVTEGMAGLELEYSFDLLKSNIDGEKRIKNDLNGIKNPGDNIYTTLDTNLQQKANDSIGYYNGALIAIEPYTGNVVAMISKPDFNPNTLENDWDYINDSANNSSVLLNRAIAGQYPPGSTFKLVTALAYMRFNQDYLDFSYKCKGSFDIDNFTIHCANSKAHGDLDIIKAMGESCNCAFATMGLAIDKDIFNSTVSDLYFNQDLPTSIINTKISSFELEESTDDKLTAQTSFGQGNTLVSPLHMCMIASAIANDGILVEPKVVSKIVSNDGYVVLDNSSSITHQLMTTKEANELSDMMLYVMTEGNSKNLEHGDYTIYGKTGTAEYNSDKDDTHSWFVGYAEDDNGNCLAIACIMEGAGYGNKFAAPLARDVFDLYFENK